MGKTKSKHFNKNNLRRTYKRRYKGGTDTQTPIKPSMGGVIGAWISRKKAPKKNLNRWPDKDKVESVNVSMEALGVPSEANFPNENGQPSATGEMASRPLIGFKPGPDKVFYTPENPMTGNPYRPGNIIGAMVSISETAKQLEYAKQQLINAKKNYFYTDDPGSATGLQYDSGDYDYGGGLSVVPPAQAWRTGLIRGLPNGNFREVINNAGNNQMIKDIYEAVDGYFFTGPNKFTRSAPTDSVPAAPTAPPNTANVDSLSAIMGDYYQKPTGMWRKLTNWDPVVVRARKNLVAKQV